MRWALFCPSHKRVVPAANGRLVVFRLLRTGPFSAGLRNMAEIKWFGHNCFRIRAKEATVIIDPVDRVTGYAMPKQTADIVAISHEDKGHSNLNAIKPDLQVVNGPGEYEMHDVFS